VVKLRVVTELLGDVLENGKRRWARDIDTNYLRLPIAQWSWALREAGRSLHLPGIDTSMIHLPRRFQKPTLRDYVRQWRDSSVPQAKRRSEVFESIAKNSVLTFYVFLPETMPISKVVRPPTIRELEDLFNFAGEFTGFSPWGSKWGFGRVRIESTRELNGNEAREACNTSRFQADAGAGRSCREYDAGSARLTGVADVHL
jgi:hypothetical protein